MSAQTAVSTQTTQAPSLIAKIASRFSVEPNRMMATLKATAFRQHNGAEISNEQMMSLLIVADQYGLNPFTKEIYAFPDKGGIVPIVGIDGWSRIINSNAQFDGMEFKADGEGALLAVTCTIWRKDRAHPISVTEYLSECKRETQPWKSHPRRMLRHKAMAQCARMAFGYVGIYDEDEAERIIEGSHTVVQDDPPAIRAINDEIAPPKTAETITQRQEVELEQSQAKGKAKAGAPTDAEIGDRIAKATTGDQVNDALALIGSRGDEGALSLIADAKAKLSDLE